MELLEIVRQHAELLDRTIKYERDYAFDYFGFKALIFFFVSPPCNLMRVCSHASATTPWTTSLGLQSTIFFFAPFFSFHYLICVVLMLIDRCY